MARGDLRYRLISVLAAVVAAAGSSVAMSGQRAAATTGPSFTIAENTLLRPVPARFLGFSIDPANLCSVVSLAQSDPAFLQEFVNLGPGVFRVGGNTGDRHASWSTTSPASCVYSKLVVTPALVDSFFAFAQSVGYQVSWQVPLDNNSPTADAAEAAYVSGESGLSSIEIGNEPNYYPSSASNYQTYISMWSSIYQDYRADGGTAPVSGPAVTVSAGFYLSPFLNQYAADISAVTGHYYVANALKGPTCSNLLSVSGLNSQTASGVAQASAHGLPFVMNETNTFSNGGAAGASNAFCSALWAAEYGMLALKNGVQGLYFHGIDDYQPGNSSGRVQYYTPINGDGTTAPEYYGLLFDDQLIADGGATVAVTPSGVPVNVTAYAVASGSGLRVALFNRTATDSTVSLQTADIYSQASAVSLTAPSYTALTGVTLGGSAVASDGTWTAAPAAASVSLAGAGATVTVPAYSGVIVTFDPVSRSGSRR